MHNHIFQLHLCRQSLSSYKHQMRPQAANQPGQPEVLALLYLGDTLCPLIFFLPVTQDWLCFHQSFPKLTFQRLLCPQAERSLGDTFLNSLSSASQGRTVTVWFSETAGKLCHWTFKDSAAAHNSYHWIVSSLLPWCSLRWESWGSSPWWEAHQTGLSHQAGVERCVRCRCR